MSEKALYKPRTYLISILVCLMPFCVSASLISTPEESLIDLKNNNIPWSEINLSTVPKYQHLSTEEKYVVMITSIQTGEIEGAMVIAEDLSAIRGNDPSVRALLAARSIQAGNFGQAESQLSHIKPKNKYERATVELVWALLEMTKGNNNRALQRIENVHRALPNHPYAFNIKGVILVTQENYTAAKTAFSKALQKIPKMIAAETNWGFTELYDGQLDQALTHFNKALAIRPDACRAGYGKALALSSKGAYAQALSSLSQCTQPHSDTERRLLMANLLIELGHYDDALKYIKRSRELDSNFDGDILLAQILLRQGNISSALQYLNGDSPEIKYYSAIAAFSSGDIKSATTDVDLILAGDQTYPSASLLKSIISLKQHKTPTSEEIIEIKKEKSLIPFANLFEAASYKNNPEKAIRLFKASAPLLQGVDYSKISDQAILSQLQPNQISIITTALFFKFIKMPAIMDKELYLMAQSKNAFLTEYILGLNSLQNSKDFSKAQQHFTSSTKAAPRFYAAHYLLAETYLKSNKLESALNQFEQATKIQKEFGAHLKAGMIAERLGQTNRAETHFRNLVNSAPDNFIGYNQLAWFLVSHNRNLSEAVSFANKADELSPKNPNVLDTLGWAYYSNGDYKKAVKTLQFASKLSNNNNPGILYHLAMSQFKLGEKETALETAKLGRSLETPTKYANQLNNLIAELQN